MRLRGSGTKTLVVVLELRKKQDRTVLGAELEQQSIQTLRQLSPHDLDMLVRWLRHDDQELED